MLSGVAIVAFEAPILPWFRSVASLIFVGLGLISVMQAWISWVASERALRASRGLPGMAVGAFISVVAAIGMILVAAGGVWS